MVLPTIISLEGNISSGKTTLFNMMKERYAHDSTIYFIEEPVSEWQSIKDIDGVDILTNFYRDQKKYAFQFQMMAYMSVLKRLKSAVLTNKYSIIISERHLETNTNVFSKMLYDDGILGLDDITIMTKYLSSFKLDKVIYLKTSPTTCEKRCIKRGRPGETIPLVYLDNLHEYHERWLNSAPYDILTLNGDLENSQDVIDNWMRSIDIHVLGYSIGF